VSFEHPKPQGESWLRSAKRDFLRSDAQTPLCEKFVAAGILFAISTNFEPILQMAEVCCDRQRIEEDVSVKVNLRLWVDPSSNSRPPRSKPYLRGLDHLIFAGLDPQNSLLLDLRDRQVLGRLTAEIAADPSLWKTVIFPVLLATFGGAAGRAVLHCGCVAWKGRGILLAGDSGSGKSTLSLALAQTGFGFVSDDRTILSLKEGQLLAAGLGPCLKLRPAATVHFPRLKTRIPTDWPNEQSAIYLDPTEEFGVERVHSCAPQSLFFLEQETGPAFSVEEISSNEVTSRLESGLPRETAEAMRDQRQVIDSVAERECYVLRYGGSPNGIAWALRGFLADRFENRWPRVHKTSAHLTRIEIPRRDPLRRFTPTPLTADFRLMRRHVRVETNSALIMEYARRALGRYGQATATLPDFVWRVISDPNSQLAPPWPEMTAFSDRQRRFVNLGQRSFIAVDLSCREAVAFVSESLVKDEVGFTSIVLASLMYLSAGALGLTAVSAACVASAEKGLLLFGVPRSGKTTSGFMARGQGYEFHADQACFLEMENGALQAWGDFWPAAFHLEASKYLPELAEFGRPLAHRAASYLCMEKHSSPKVKASCVVPVACIFLEREAADPPKLIALSARDFTRMLDQGIPFKEDAGPEEARRAVYRALGKLPAFRLLYDSKPSVPSLFFRSLLNTHQVVESLG